MIQRRPSWPDPWRCTVEVLVVSGCPGTQLAVARINEATSALAMETNLRFVTVQDEAQAKELRFVGSPTVRVEGEDVEDVSGRPFGLSCRLYDTDDGTTERAPSLASIRAALARSNPIVRARSAI